MPEFWNNILVVTKDELVPAFFSYDALQKQVKRNAKNEYGIKKIRNGGGGHPALYSFDSLPGSIQDALGDPRKCDHILERYYKVDGEAVAFFSTFRFEEDNTTLEPEYQERYIINASVLKALISLRADRLRERKTKGGTVRGVVNTLCEDAISFQKTLKAKFGVQHTLPPGHKAFKLVFNAFEGSKLNYRSLISGKHKNANSRKVFDTTLALLESMFAGADEKPTATKVHRQYESFLSGYLEVINNETGEVYDPKGFKKLSPTTVTNYLAGWSSKIGTFAARSGDRQKLMGQFKPHHSFDRPALAGSIISIDDRQPPFKALDGKRLWFYNGIDLGSEAFTCWVYGDTKEGIITEFYRQLVRNYAEWGVNLPAELEAELSLNSSFTDTFLREGAMFQYTKILPNNARGKRIERYFRDLRYNYEKDKKGWLARPFALSEANQSGRPIESVPMLPKDDIIESCLKDIENWNNTPHSVHTHMTRWEVFVEMQNPELRPTNYATILPHIGNHTRTSVNTGIIRLQRQEFLLGLNGSLATGETLISLMKQVEGEQVDVYWLDSNDREVLKALVYCGTQLVCEAVAKPTYNRARIERTDEDLVSMEQMNKYVSTIEAFQRSQKRSIDRITILDNTPALKKTFVMRGINQAKRVDEWQEPDTLAEMPIGEEFDVPVQSFTQSLRDRF